MRPTARLGKWIRKCFSSELDLFHTHTDMMNIIHGYLLEGTQATNNIKTELYKLDVYRTHLSTVTSASGWYYVTVTTQVKGHPLNLTLIRHAAIRCSACW